MTDTLSRRAVLARRYASVCDEILDINKSLNAKTREKEELERLLFGGDGEVFYPPIENPREGTEIFHLFEVFRGDPDKEWKMKSLMAALKEDYSNGHRRNVVRHRLYRLVRRGLVDKIGRGIYRLKRDPWTDDAGQNP